MDQNNQGVPPMPGYQNEGTQSAGQPYGQPYADQQGYQSYQQYQQQGYPDFTGQGAQGGSLVVNAYARAHLRSIGGWTKFISIVSIIALTLGIAMFILMMTSTTSILGRSSYTHNGIDEQTLTVVMIIYIVILAIFYLPAIWGVSAGSKMKKAALFGDENELEEGLRKWKYVCTFMGVLTIIYSVFLVLGFIGFIVGLAMA